MVQQETNKSLKLLIDIPVGMSGTLKNFTNIYNKKFLQKKGLAIKTRGQLHIIPIEGLTVVADDNTIFTYLGEKTWTVHAKEKSHSNE